MEDLHVVEDTTVCLVPTEWLSVVASHLDLDSCILFGIATYVRLGSYKYFVIHSGLCCTCVGVSLQSGNTSIILIYIV